MKIIIIYYNELINYNQKMAPPALATKVSTNSDGSVTVNYTPNKSGVHDVNVTYNEKSVTGEL